MQKRLDIKEKLQKMSRKERINERTDPPVLKAKDPDEIEDVRAEDIVLERLSSIEDLAIPATVDELTWIEVVHTPGKLTQTLSLKERPGVRLRWTVFNDPEMEEFDFLKSEGMVRIEENPPIYVLEIGGGILFVSHIGDYTFSMGGYDLNKGYLLKLFMSALNSARRFKLKS